MISNRRLSKEEINALPLRYYNRFIKVLESEKGVFEACTNLKSESVLGFDTETRPAFKTGQYFLPSLLQLAGNNKVYLFRLNKIGLPLSLKSLLEDHSIIKTGVAVNQDVKEMLKISDFYPRNFIDLGDLSHSKGLKHHGLRGLAALLLNFRISKGSRTSNWDVEILTDNQIKYAATDAWVSRKIYFSLSN